MLDYSDSASIYHPLNLDASTHEIRLLRIRPKQPFLKGSPAVQCDLVHANIDDTTIYKALSYTWGDEWTTTHDILINDSLVTVRANLYHALLQLQKSFRDEFLLWVNAVCIDQSNVTERNHQVAQMYQLYKHAEEVIAWLGVEADDSKTAFKFIKQMYAHKDHINTFWPQLALFDLSRNLHAFVSLMLRSYWQRVWVVQELMACTHITILCGHDKVDWLHLGEVQRLYFEDRYEVSTSIMEIFGGVDSNHMTRFLPMYAAGPRTLQRSQAAIVAGWSLFDVLRYYPRSKVATDPRDMIYAMSSAVDSLGHGEILVDYNCSVSKLYTQFTRDEILRSGKLEVWTALSERKPEILGLPSWVIDWSEDVGSKFFYFDLLKIANAERYHKRFQAATGTKAIFTFQGSCRLRISGVRVGSIEKMCNNSSTTLEGPDTTLVPALQEWSTILLSKTRSFEQQVRQLSRTLVVDCLTLLRKGFDSCVYYPLLGNLVSKARPMNEIKDILPFYAHSTTRVVINMSEQQVADLCYSYSQIIRLAMLGRRLFYSSQLDTIGICPENADPSDVLFVPFGCPLVMVLRPVADHSWIIIGPAYLDAFMYGEAMTMFENGQLESCEIVVQ